MSRKPFVVTKATEAPCAPGWHWWRPSEPWTRSVTEAGSIPAARGRRRPPSSWPAGVLGTFTLDHLNPRAVHRNEIGERPADFDPDPMLSPS